MRNMKPKIDFLSEADLIHWASEFYWDSPALSEEDWASLFKAKVFPQKPEEKTE
jgi:hypothetical protein